MSVKSRKKASRRRARKSVGKIRGVTEETSFPNGVKFR